MDTAKVKPIRPCPPIDWIRDPTPAGLLVYLTILILLSTAVLVAVPSSAGPVTERVDVYLQHLVRLAPKHPARRAEYRHRLAKAIAVECTDHGVPVDLVVAVAYRESSLRDDVTGPGGELGIMQVHPGTAARHRCDLSTVEGQVECGVRLLALYHRECGTGDGTWGGAVARYGSRSGTCTPAAGSGLARMVADRTALAAELTALP